jgi:hypothetical protein
VIGRGLRTTDDEVFWTERGGGGIEDALADEPGLSDDFGLGPVGVSLSNNSSTNDAVSTPYCQSSQRSGRSQLPLIQETLELAEEALSHFFNRWSRLQDLKDVVREDFRIRLSAANMSVSPQQTASSW